MRPAPRPDLEVNWLSLAFRNLLRNSRRSITTIAAVAIGYAAVNIFGGFASYMFVSIREAYIYDQAFGHVQVWKKGAREYGGSDPGAFLLSAGDFEAVKEFARTDGRVRLAAGMLEVKGQMDVDGVPAFFLSRAMVPSELSTFQNASITIHERNNLSYEGEAITDDKPYAIGITYGISKNLKIGLGKDVILMAPTVQGQMNATDARVFQLIDTPTEELDNRYVSIPLELAQSLYDTRGVTSIRILLKDRKQSDAVAQALREAFAEKEWEVLVWNEVSAIYRRTKKMFDIIFGMVFAIIITIVTMSVLNTIGMAVLERTKEIGTLRAIGLKRPGVIRLFCIESAFLGLIGAMIGLAITVAFSLAVDRIQPTWEPPMVARAVVWQILLVPGYLLFSFLMLVAFTFAAAFLPSRRAARQRIVDALGHV
jgi:putative ABC transport system permease protein